MTLAHYDWETPLELDVKKPCVLVVENPCLFRRTVSALNAQCAGADEPFVLSQRYEILRLSQQAELLSDVLRTDPANKQLSAAIAKYVAAAAREDQTSALRLLQTLNAFAAQLLPALDFDLTYSPLEDLAGVIKLFDFSPDTQELTLNEKLLEYMRLTRHFLKKKLFIFVNLKAFLSAEELAQLYQMASYEELYLLLLEPQVRFPLPQWENQRIIDDDLCEI